MRRREALGDVRHKRGAKTVQGQRHGLTGRGGERSLVVVCAVVGAFDMNPTNSLNSFSLLILVQMMRSSRSAPCGLQQGIVWTPAIMGLIQEDVEGLFIDSSLGELHLGECYTRD